MYVEAAPWQASTAFAQDVYIRPGRKTDASYTFLYLSTGGGTTAASPPAWPLILGQTVNDGSVTWACAGLGPIIDVADIEQRLSRRIVINATDDDDDGFADELVVGQIRVDATSYVFGFLGGAYDFPLGSPYPNELVRIALDVATAYLARRHPEIVQYDSTALLEQARAELKDLKVGITRLEIPLMGTRGQNQPPATTPAAPPPRNIGGLIELAGPRMIISSSDGTDNNGLF